MTKAVLSSDSGWWLCRGRCRLKPKSTAPWWGIGEARSIWKARSVLGGAGGAGAVDLKGVAGGAVVEFAGDLLFEAVDLGGEEFYGGAAFGTDHMVVAAAS